MENNTNTQPLPPTTAEPNVDLEKKLLSSMLLKEGEVVPAISAILNPDDFYRPEHRIIFRYLVNQYSKLNRTDFIALVQELKTTGDLQKVGTEFVFSLMQWSSTTAYSEYYARIIKDIANKRLLNDITTKIIADTRAGFKSVEEIIADANAAFDKLQPANYSDLFGDDAATYFKEHFQSFVDKNKQFADRKTGFSNIDDRQLFKPGVYVLGGLPALGKTTFALQLLAQLADKGESCIFCSYEMEKGFLYSKLLAREVAKIETFNFLTVNIIDNPLTAVQISQNKIYEHGDAYRDAISKFANNPPLYIWELDDPNIDKLLARLDKICAKLDKPPIVCIDYLQILAVGSENVKSSVDSILQKIIAFKRKTDTTFIIISSLNRANYNTEISFESFKESGSIEYGADVILGMQLYLKSPRTPADADKAKKSNPRPIHIKFLKNRFGANFDCYFKYYPTIDYFEPATEEDFEKVEGPPEPCNKNNEPDE